MAFVTTQPTYQRLRASHAERLRPVVFWVGAGLSQPAGLPSWPRLRDLLIEKGLETAAVLQPEEGKALEEALERAAAAISLWDAFQILKKALGRTEFREEVREIFTKSRTAEIPRLYGEIWSLPGVRGMLTLNLDEFAAKSHKRARLDEDPSIFFGRDAPEYSHVLGSARPFIGNLHGVMDANSSWVFTRDEISNLVATPGYKQFISFVFSQMTVVFCGISADDAAAGGFLESLTSEGLDLGAHFWITDRTDLATHTWASSAGIGVVRYQPVISTGSFPDHTTPLSEMFADMRAYVSVDKAAKPLIPNVEEVLSLPSVRELRALDDDDLRTKLSGYAKYLLSKDDFGSIDNYKIFLKDYSPSIHQAWHVTADEPYNKFYDYIVDEKISTSPFSSVWRLKNVDGSYLALKIVQFENRGEGSQIESFRRGVESLTYLTNANVPGTPSLVSAFEIPTAVVMDYVEGSSLQEIVLSGAFDAWKDGLPVMSSVCSHLKFGHSLPQGVLHRDVRPSNIMIPNFFWQYDFSGSLNDKYDIKLLNYDMSWHANAKGSTISGNLDESGFYAPEHFVQSGESARTTLVDSYGVGMCLYFAFTKRKPPTAGSKSTDWAELLREGFRPQAKLDWRSAPERLRRLVERSTSPEQNDRPMIDQIQAELDLLRAAVSGDHKSLPPEFWAEELMSRAEEASYHPLPSGLGVYREPRVGRTISLEGDSRKSRVLLKFRNQALDSTNRSGLDKTWKDKLQRAREVLASAGWEIHDDTRYSSMEVLLAAEISIDKIRTGLDKVLQGLIKGVGQVRID